MTKINKIPEFYIIFVRNMPEFYIIIARKIFFPNFRGHVLPLPPVLYACGPDIFSLEIPIKNFLALKELIQCI